MRRPKISLKKYFYFIMLCALVLVFVINLKEHEIWKSKSRLAQLLQSHSELTTISATNDAIKKDEPHLADAQPPPAPMPADAPISELTKQLSQLPDNDMNEIIDNNLDFSNAYAGMDENNNLIESLTLRPWFFKNGEYYPVPFNPELVNSNQKDGKSPQERTAKLFPYQNKHSDRIFRQLMYVPHNYDEIRASGKLKKILLFNGLGPWNVKQGRDVFIRSKCPVDTCEITANRDRVSTADMILYKDHYVPTGIRRPLNSRQVSMLYYLECPYHTQNVKFPDAINWTATYRRDSTIVTPYEKWQFYNPKIRQMEQNHSYAANKTKKVAWFVSNCGARNGRLQFALDLRKYIEVDIYGACGNYKCSRSNADRCFQMLDHDYKFYLAFENSNCKHYITEKFFVNALNRNILPIVMGARPEDYEKAAPPRSYIHVDEFASPKELAEYLHILDKNDDLYNSYFKWKGTGEFINTYFWCRVCATLHDEQSLSTPHWYADINEWWRGPGVCTNNSWRSFKARKDLIIDD